MGFMSVMVLLVFMLTALAMIILLWIGSIVLQIFLSRMKSKWPGLILPSIIFFIALVATIKTTIDINASIQAAFMGFLVGNIGTAIYLLIYFLVRRKKQFK